MKLVLFDEGRPGLMKGDGVVDISDALSSLGAPTGQGAMEALITHFDELRAELSQLEQDGNALPLSEVSLRAPLPSLVRSV